MDDWDTVTKIGSKTRGGSSQHQTVVRGNGALNEAQRSGTIIGTEKKFATGNAAKNVGNEGQRLTKVDRAVDPVGINAYSSVFGAAVSARRQQDGYKMTRAQLAKKVNETVAEIANLENGVGSKKQGLVNNVARVLAISPKDGKPIVNEPKRNNDNKKAGKKGTKKEVKNHKNEVAKTKDNEDEESKTGSKEESTMEEKKDDKDKVARTKDNEDEESKTEDEESKTRSKEESALEEKKDNKDKVANTKDNEDEKSKTGNKEESTMKEGDENSPEQVDEGS